jgi:toxin ParE1/3/4
MTHYWIAPIAEQDMEAIGDFIAQDNPHRALTFIAELRNQYTRVAASPKVFRLRPELGNDYARARTEAM